MRRGRASRRPSRRSWRGAIRAAGGKAPGFGHPVHRLVDPRAERILELADERGVSGPHVAARARFRDAVAEAWGKPLTMNVSHADRGGAARPRLRSGDGQGDPAAGAHRRACSRTWPRSSEQPVGFLMAGRAEEAIAYEPPAEDAAG